MRRTKTTSRFDGAQQNARLRDERERSPDGMTASERAMAQSAVAATATAGAEESEAQAKAGDSDLGATVGCGRPAAPPYPADVAETIAETGAYPPPLDRIDGERLADDAKRRAADPDPDRCATPRCKREPAMTYLGKPLC